MRISKVVAVFVIFLHLAVVFAKFHPTHIAKEQALAEDSKYKGKKMRQSPSPPAPAQPLLELDHHRSSRDRNASVVHQLMEKLFSCYHKAASIVLPLVVNVEVEREGIFESVVAIFIRWHDARLEWDPAEFGNVTALSLDADQVGLPDIVMTNSADHLYSITRHSKFTVRLLHNGYLKYVPTGTARTWCDLKLFDFPFDVQTCSMEFESWSLDKSIMKFDGKSALRLDEFFTSQLWTLCRLNTTTYDHKYFTNETFSRIRFDITFARKSTFYIINLIFPCTMLSLVQLLVFVLSSIDTTADRIGFSTTNLLTLVVFQTIVTEELPKTSDAVTSLSKYVIALIITSAVGIFESVVVERMIAIRRRPPPTIIYNIFRPLPLLWREMPPPSSSSTTSTSNHSQPPPCKHDANGEPKTGGEINKPWKLRGSRRTVRRSTVVVSGFRSRNNTPETITQVEKVRENSYVNPITVSNEDEKPTNGDVVYEADYQMSSPRSNYEWYRNYSLYNMAPYTLKSPKRASPRKPASSGSKATSPRYKCSEDEMQAGDSDMERVIRRRRNRQSVVDSDSRRRNARLWMELAFKLDIASFMGCLFMSIFFPIALFFPSFNAVNSCEKPLSS